MEIIHIIIYFLGGERLVIKSLLKSLPKSYQLPFRYAYSFLPPKIRYGQVFRDTYELLAQSQYWNEEEIKTYQLLELKKLLTHCNKNVPFYKELFKNYDINLESFQSISEISLIPFLTKDIIRQNIQVLKAGNFSDRHMERITTGGSSGVPLSFYQQKDYADAREHAFIATIWNRVGFRYGFDERLVLRGAIVNHDSGIEYQPASRELVCSTYQMTSEKVKTYLEVAKKRNIKFIHGHISSIALLAQHMVNNNLFYPLKAVLGASENVYPFQRELVFKAFGTKLYTFYGHTERSGLASECEFSTNYHISPEYGIFELVDEDGKVITKPNALGEIVVTGFNNLTMPFIRYKTGDLAQYVAGFCLYCGRKHKLIKNIEGRNYEFIITSDNQKISLTGLIFGQHFESFADINKLQIYQEKIGEVDIRILPGKNYCKEKSEGEFSSIIYNAISDRLKINFVYPGDIPLTERGKHRFLIQKLKI